MQADQIWKFSITGTVWMLWKVQKSYTDIKMVNQKIYVLFCLLAHKKEKKKKSVTKTMHVICWVALVWLDETDIGI